MAIRYLSRARTTAALLALITLPLLACETGGRTDATTRVAPAPAPEDDYVAHLEPAPAVRFPLKRTGLRLDVRSFDPTLPAEKFRHEMRLVTDADDVEGMIHVWDNPLHLAVQPWFDANLGGFVGEATVVRERTAGKAKLAALQLDEPASEQAFSQSMVVFATRDHVYLITAIDPEQVPAAKALFDRVVDGFEPEVTR